jgi:hypothetical protein
MDKLQSCLLSKQVVHELPLGFKELSKVLNALNDKTYLNAIKNAVLSSQNAAHHLTIASILITFRKMMFRVVFWDYHP